MSDDHRIIARGGRHRWPDSFRRASQKPTRAQRANLRDYWPQFGLECPYGQLVDPAALFGESHVTLEIGAGMGESLLSLASQNPSRSFIAAEVHRPALGHMLGELKRQQLHNVRLTRCDALSFLNDHLSKRCLDEVWIFFPDPFDRPRDNPRRLVRPLLLDLLAARCKPMATVHLATDVANYANHMHKLFSDDARFSNPVLTRPDWRVPSKYERKAVTPIVDMNVQLLQ